MNLFRFQHRPRPLSHLGCSKAPPALYSIQVALAQVETDPSSSATSPRSRQRLQRYLRRLRYLALAREHRSLHQYRRNAHCSLWPLLRRLPLTDIPTWAASSRRRLRQNLVQLLQGKKLPKMKTTTLETSSLRPLPPRPPTNSLLPILQLCQRRQRQTCSRRRPNNLHRPPPPPRPCQSLTPPA